VYVSTMGEPNPYVPPKSSEAAQMERETPEQERAAFEALLRSLGWIRAWLALYFVLGILAAFVLVLGAVLLVAYGNSPFGMVQPLFIPVWSGLVAFYVLLALRFRSAREGADYAAKVRTIAAVAEAVELQRRVWSYLGWSTLVALGLYLLRSAWL